MHTTPGTNIEILRIHIVLLKLNKTELGCYNSCPETVCLTISVGLRGSCSLCEGISIDLILDLKMNNLLKLLLKYSATRIILKCSKLFQDPLIS